MKVKEIGNLTTDPTYGEKDDLKYCNFNIAINNPFDKDKTEFVRVSAYGKQAESCRDYLQKGSQVCIEGNVKANAYIDKDGNAQASLNINANEVQFLNRIKHREGREQNQDGHAAIDNALRKSEQNQAVSPPQQPAPQTR